MRAIWSGSLTFGLVNVPVKMYSATSSHDVAFHQVHGADGGRIRYERRCEVCGKKVDYENIDKAYDDGEQTVVLTEEDLEELPADADADEVDVVRFVPAEQIDPIMYEKPYLLEPTGKSPKAYALLRRTLEETDRIAVVRFTLRQRTRLGALRVRGDVLVLQGLLWADEVRDIDIPAAAQRTGTGRGKGRAKSSAGPSAEELRMASALVEQFSGDFHPEEYEDDYQDELRELIDAKLEHGDAIDTEATFGREKEDDDENASGSGSGSGGTGGSGGKVLDLMGALEASLASRGGQGARSTGESTEKEAPATKKKETAPATKKKETAPATKKEAVTKKAPARKAPAKKTPAKKTAAKKTPAKKAPAKKASGGTSAEGRSSRKSA